MTCSPFASGHRASRETSEQDDEDETEGDYTGLELLDRMK